MLKTKRHWGIFALTVVMFFLSLTLFSGSGISLSVLGVAPLLVLSLLIPYCAHNSVMASGVTGFLCGAVLDSVAADSYCFNTIALLILAVSANLLAHSVFNRNLKATIALSLLLSLIYFIFYWIIFIAFSLDFSGNSKYLLQIALPSSVYTAVLSAPFFFIFKHFERKRNEF